VAKIVGTSDLHETWVTRPRDLLWSVDHQGPDAFCHVASTKATCHYTHFIPFTAATRLSARDGVRKGTIFGTIFGAPSR